MARFNKATGKMEGRAGGQLVDLQRDSLNLQVEHE